MGLEHTDAWTSEGRENMPCIATCEKRDCGTELKRRLLRRFAFEEGL